MEQTSIILSIIGAFIGGAVLSFFLWRWFLGVKSSQLIKEAEAESEVIKKEKMLQA
ncbi:MAG: hypothetical protein IPO21_20420 [Bacteroidales bacterium]|nr:hypothetical protein [Bacteroidales bacterium]